jgi:Zn-dependent protease with chaperone function
VYMDAQGDLRIGAEKVLPDDVATLETIATLSAQMLFNRHIEAQADLHAAPRIYAPCGWD